MPTYDLLFSGQRRDADTSPVADGGTHPILFNAIGRVKASVLPAAMPNVTGAITTATSVVGPIDVARVSNVTVELVGTFAGVNVTFETSLDGTNWKAEQALRSNAATIETTSGVLGAAPAYSWELSVNGKSFFRVRATAWTSGTANVIVGIGAFATEPFVTVPAHGITGNVAVTMAAGATSSPAKAEDAAHASADVGVFALAVRNDNAASAPTSANGDYSQISVDANGAVFTRERPAPTSAVTTVAASASSVTLLASNAARRGATIYNDSTVTLFVKLGATASSSSFTIKLAADGYYEVPSNYSGVIDGIWASATGNARVTEIS